MDTSARRTGQGEPVSAAAETPPAAPPPAGRGRAGRTLAALAAVAAVAAVAVWIGLGVSPDQLSARVDGAGPWLPLAFVAVHAVVCAAPVPRTAFTVAAGLLFPPLTGVALALAGTAGAAVLAFAVTRALGREAVRRRLAHPAVVRIDDRLRRRGWLAVGSLRLIPVVPFSVLNYCCAVSGVRMLPYLAATVLGSLPGTVAVVCFGAAVRSGPGGTAWWLSAVAIAAGVTGLVVDQLLERRRSRTSTVIGP